MPGYSQSQQTSAMSARCRPSPSATTTSIALVDRSVWRLLCRAAASSAGGGVAAGPRWSPLRLRASRLTPTRLLPPDRFLGMSLGRRFRPQRTDQGASPLPGPEDETTKRAACHRRCQGLTPGSIDRSGGREDMLIQAVLTAAAMNLLKLAQLPHYIWRRAAALASSLPARAFVSSVGD